ncbi:MAG: RnfABCDGE type electron transport complex subunit B [Bacillota bacterium]|jgi:electron transport complex protein RnfB|nr:RnfABCDGE type electron transport complex subunit B [Candidatus Fermentithermobacillaceae bacterium]
MLTALVTLGAAGLVFGSFLALAAQKFRVEEDPKIAEILAVLPGANCGACGFPGCAGLAAAIAKGEAPCNACVPGGDGVAEKLASIMGMACDAVEPMIAVVYCQGDDDRAEIVAEYHGVMDCKALDQLGGSKGCPYGCLGLGTCVRACPFDAMYMSPKGLPVVIEKKCTGCGACVRACPRGVIDLAPVSKRVHILCKSYDKGPQVRKYCKVGCIACRICVRSCPQKAISMDRDTLAKIDYSLCDNCGICATKCPAKTIVDRRRSEAGKQVS